MKVPFFIFPRAFFKKDSPENFLLLFVGVIIFNVVVARSIEDRIVVVIAIRVAVPDFLVNGLSLRLRLVTIKRKT